MILHILRAMFILLMAAVGWFFLSQQPSTLGSYTFLTMAASLTIGVLVLCIDILSPRRKLAILSGTVLGLLVGILVSFALSFVIRLLVDQIGSIDAEWQTYLQSKAVDLYAPASEAATRTNADVITNFIQLVVGIVCCYLSISFVLQTKDDFRFIIPYVEFSKQTKGNHPLLIDTSVLIDGRINDIAATGILESQLIVPRFVLDELQHIADSSDKLKRNRGRRGLDVLTKLQANKNCEVILYDSSVHAVTEAAGVDQKLVVLAKQIDGRILTTDFNLNKVAQLRGVGVLNINDLSSALKPVVLPGERLRVRLVEPGEQPGQGVGYLEDGTMVVVEGGRSSLDAEVEFSVTNVVQTSAGRMVFGRLGDGVAPPPRRPRPRSDAQSNPT